MDNIYSSKNNNNNNVIKRLKIIFLTTILSFGAVINIYSLSSSSSNFAFLKDVEALQNQEYVLGYRIIIRITRKINTTKILILIIVNICHH